MKKLDLSNNVQFINKYLDTNILLEYLEHESIHTVITLHDCWFFTGKCFHYQVAKCDRFKDSCGDCPLIKKDVPSWFFDPTAKVLSDKKKLFNSNIFKKRKNHS